MVSLYINDRLVELSEELNIEMTYQSVDVYNPSAIKNSFSKTVTIPGTLSNNQLFGEIWSLNRTLVEHETNLTGIYFDARKRVPFTITECGLVVESGYMQLNTIDITNDVIKYNITLFGGLGDFFYNLMSNDDGTDKTLANLYYKWRPVYNPIYNPTSEQDVLTPEDEANSFIMNWSSGVCARALAGLTTLDPLDEPTFITDDIVPIPIYSGLYDDFQSDTMILDVSNRTDWTTPQGGFAFTSQFAEIANQQFPFLIVDNQINHRPYEYTDNSKFMLTKVEREMEPFEARDLRATRLNVGMKLSKLMRTIANPYNNGGYQVEFDEELTSSPQWKYTWLMLNKPNFEYDAYNIQAGQFLSFNWSEQSRWEGTYEAGWTSQDKSIDLYVRPQLTINYAPLVTVQGFQYGWIYQDPIYPANKIQDEAKAAYNHISMFGVMNQTGTNLVAGYKWSGLFSIMKIMDGDKQIDEIQYLFYYGNGNKLGHNGTTQLKPYATIVSEIRQGLWISLPQYNSTAKIVVVDEKNMPDVLSYRPDLRPGDLSYFEVGTETSNRHGDYTRPGWMIRTYIDRMYEFKAPEQIVEIPKDTKNLRVVVENHYVGYCLTTSNQSSVVVDGKMGGTYSFPSSFANRTFFVPTIYNDVVPGDLEPRLYLNTNDRAYDSWAYPQAVSFSGVTEAGLDVHTLVRANKNILLKDSDTPYRYLTDFTKLLNYRYDYDRVTKTVNIIPRHKYYKNIIVDLSEDIDYSKQILINANTADKKYTLLEYKKAETYPSFLYRNLKKPDYGSVIFNTKYSFNEDTNNLFDGMIFADMIPYQLRSNFFHNNDISKFLTIFNVVSHTNTLWRPTNRDTKVDRLFNFDGAGMLDPFNAGAVDDIPKLSAFDKDNSYVEEVTNNFVFLNGFYKNTFETITDDPFFPVVFNYPIITISDKIPWMDDNCGECYYWCRNYDSNQNNHYQYYDYYAAPKTLPYFSKYLYNQEQGGLWTPADNILATWHITAPKKVFIDERNIEFVNELTSYSTHDETYKYEGTLDYFGTDTYLYDKFWKAELEDMYDKDARTVSLYARLKDNPNEALKKFYYFEGCHWIITKIENYNISKGTNQFNKITFLKVKNISNYVNG